MQVYKEFTEQLNDLFKSIRREITKGRVDSHVGLEYNGDTFRVIKKIKQKSPVVKTFQVPQEDRDESIVFRDVISSLRKDEPFQRLLQAIRSTRNLMYSDEIWKKNIISFMGDEYTLEDFIREIRHSTKEVDFAQVKKAKDMQEYTKGIEQEQNVALQALYQSLLVKRLNETNDVKEYDVWKDVLVKDKVIHAVRTESGEEVWQKDGERLKGTFIRSLKSLREYVMKDETNNISQTMSGASLGSVETFMQYTTMMNDMVPLNLPQKIKEFSYIASADPSVTYELGKGPQEAIKEGHVSQGGSVDRLMASYVTTPNQVPIVSNGVLYKNKIAAIMSYKIPNLGLGNIGEDTADEYLWDAYSTEYKKSGTARKALLTQEKKVLVESYHMFSEMAQTLRRTNTVWYTNIGNKQFIHHHGLQNMILNLDKYRNVNSKKNANVMLEWILRNRRWLQEGQRMGLIDDSTEISVKMLKKVVGTIYGFHLTLSDLVEDSSVVVRRAMEEWIETKKVDWTLYDVQGASTQESILISEYASPRVSVEELMTYVREYSDTIYENLKRGNDTIVDRTDVVRKGIVMGVFLSILHPKMNQVQRGVIRIRDMKRSPDVIMEVRITRKDRDGLRQVMEMNGITNFELEMIDDEGGVSERKEGMEIEDGELERGEGELELDMWYGGGVDIRVAFK